MDNDIKGLNFNYVFSIHEKPIRDYILRMVREKSAADDLTQEVFLKVHNNLASFQNKSKLSTWIYRIATNVCLDYFRSSSYKKGERTQTLESDISHEDSRVNESRGNLSVEEHVIKVEMGGCVREHVDGLPEDYRTVIILHDLQALKNREIAEILSCSLDTVKIRLHRARKKLKAILESNCDFDRDDSNVLGCDRKAE
ncbi:sigma-70 family RNA polymerase sigma factor [candidate division KSB1 bacterium]|nr:sigma-70 family RNA polymerase sigma factor [candidate division KSB1 bacterium]